jgi:hypothetical protein
MSSRPRATGNHAVATCARGRPRALYGGRFRERTATSFPGGCRSNPGGFGASRDRIHRRKRGWGRPSASKTAASEEKIARAADGIGAAYLAYPARDASPTVPPQLPADSSPVLPRPPRANQQLVQRGRRCRPSLLRRHFARACLHCRESGGPMGSAERLYSGRRSERRFHRRPALRRRDALHQECRRCARVLAGAVAGLQFVGGLGMTALTSGDGRMVVVRSVPDSGCGSAPMLAISNSRNARPGTRSDR